MKHRIAHITARQIFDSRGTPTVQARVETDSGFVGIASVPSGASTGIHEAHEKRDGEKAFGGKGVTKAVDTVNKEISALLQGISIFDSDAIDRKMIEADGSENKSSFGANAILSVSLAAARAAASALQIPLFRYIGGSNACIMPVPLMNILNGGVHASNGLDFQEFMIAPVGADTFSDAFAMGVEVYHSLKETLQQQNLSTAVGDEGGFAPDIADERQALELIVTAIEKAGYEPQKDIAIALDAAAGEWAQSDGYLLPKKQTVYSKEELIELYSRLVQQFPIISIEDPLAEDDFDGFTKITKMFHGKVQIVGDDLFVTNPDRLITGISKSSANAVLVKPNQIGSLSETMETVRLAHRNNYRSILSHRSGETEDTTIADLAVALNCGQIKTGAPARSERVAKYNRLLKIEQILGGSAKYLGRAAFAGGRTHGRI